MADEEGNQWLMREGNPRPSVAIKMPSIPHTGAIKRQSRCPRFHTQVPSRGNQEVIRHVHIVQHHVGSLREEPQGGHLWGAKRRGEHLHAGVVSSSVHERRARRAQGERKASARRAQGELKASSRRARTHLARELHIGTDVEEGGRVRCTARA